MAVVMLITSSPLGVAQAGMIATETVIEQQQKDQAAPEQGPSARDKVRDLLARDDVRSQMMSLGITPEEADARIAALTDQEIAEIAGKLDRLPAGEGLGTILIVLFIVFGVAVLLDALGMMNIFPFVCGPGQCGPTAQAYAPEPAAGPAYGEPYTYEEPRQAYRRDQFGRYDGRSQRGYESNQYYEPQPQPRTRNYYEERFGAQRQVR